ncbi:MAG: hypothetical protein Q8M66_02115 [Actinomycetota bacterium]|nr:hypothetical protein [Actinomycetota bacterium]MDZ4178877.1 hypothetical protein [Coriobacteriia bacterium]
MNRIIIAAVATLLLLIPLVGCGSPDAENHEGFDDSIHALERVLVRYVQISPNETAEAIVSATARVSQAWSDVVAESELLDDVDLSEAQRAYDELEAAVGALPADANAGEAMSSIMPLVEAFEEAVEEVHEAGDYH